MNTSNNEQVFRAITEASLGDDGFDQEVEHKVAHYVYSNAGYMHEVTASMVTKVAELAVLCPDDWEQAADMVVLSYKGRMQKFLS